MPEAHTESMELEIAHVLLLDIVAYSRLPMDQQERALRHLQEAVREPEFLLRIIEMIAILVWPID